MKVNTVLGSLDTKDMGYTLMHEHIMIANHTMRRMGADWGGVFLRLRELEERVDLEAVRFPPVDFVAMFLSFLSGGQVVGRKWKSRAMPSRDSAPAAQQ